MNKQLKSFVVKRSKWGRNSLLNSSNGKMCCLGFLSLACGLEKRHIEDVDLPGYIHNDEARKKLALKAPFLFMDEEYNSAFTDTATDINDSKTLSNKEIEKQLKEHFKTVGVVVKFVD